MTQETSGNHKDNTRTSKAELVKDAIIITIFILAIFSRPILSIATGSQAPIAVVDGYSMFPVLRMGDIVFSYKCPPQDIHVGDIIIYRGIDGRLIIHRVIKIIVRDGEYYYVTKGDNNPIEDYFEFTGPGIPYSRVVGKVFDINGAVFKIPYLGYVSIWFHNLI
ncbi:MAG: signal peptidase I [Crenarchaeota archaeon]|nr:signal peptidase I [Thermoproteota archaeon]